ncbi:hypothetical protein JCM21900_002761 [Sporobolomyces salmonicolor]
MAPLVVPNADSGCTSSVGLENRQEGDGGSRTQGEQAFKEGDSDLAYLDRAAILRPQALRLHSSFSSSIPAEHNGEETTTVRVTKHSRPPPPPPLLPASPPPSSSSTSHLAAILGSTLGALALLSVFSLTFVFICRRPRRGASTERYAAVPPSHDPYPTHHPGASSEGGGERSAPPLMAAVPRDYSRAGGMKRSGYSGLAGHPPDYEEAAVSSTAEERDEKDLLRTAARGHTPPELEARAAASGYDDHASIPIVGLGTATPTPPSSDPVVDPEAETGCSTGGRGTRSRERAT